MKDPPLLQGVGGWVDWGGCRRWRGIVVRAPAGGDQPCGVRARWVPVELERPGSPVGGVDEDLLQVVAEVADVCNLDVGGHGGQRCLGGPAGRVEGGHPRR